MTPEKSYRIWFTQRNGSTLLCKGLESTGVAGKPGEYFNVFNHANLCEEHDVSTYEELKEKLWQLGSSSNGVLGIKHSWFTQRSNKIVQEIAELRGMPFDSSMNKEALFADIFPNCKHIFLTRRNKIRQAVSWWKAIKDNVWHIEKGKSHQNNIDFYKDKYNFDALSHLFKEANLRECAIQNYFSDYGIAPLTLVYEDFIQDFEGTVKTIVDYLEIDAPDLKVDDFYYEKTANDRSEEWVQRFRKEIQEGNEQIW